MALSAREKAEAARYKPSKKKKSTKKKKVDMRSAREKKEASFAPKKKKSLRPKARGYKISTTTVSVTPTKKPQNERRRNILSKKAAFDKEIAKIQKEIDANLKQVKQLNKK